MEHHAGDTYYAQWWGHAEHLQKNRSCSKAGRRRILPAAPPTPTKAAEELLKRMLDRLLETMRENGCLVTFSIGTITYIDRPVSADAMLMEADARMYSVKQAGKNEISHVTVKKKTVAIRIYCPSCHTMPKHHTKLLSHIDPRKLIDVMFDFGAMPGIGLYVIISELSGNDMKSP